MGIIGGNKAVIERTRSLRAVLLDSVKCVEEALAVTPDGTWSYSLGEVIA